MPLARTIAAVMLAGGLGACAGSGPRQVVASGSTADARPAAERRCARWIVGASAATVEQRIVVLGGGYGTAEVPRFLADLICQLGAKGPVVLALDWPRSLASSLNLFVGGSKAAAERLRGDALWTHATARSEGRASQAMWQLLEQLQALRAAGVELAVVPFGAEFSGDGDDSSERWYAQNAVSSGMRRYADSTFVVWVDEADGEYTPGESDTMAASLREQYEKLRSFQLEPVSATAAASAPAAPVASTSTSPSPSPSTSAPWSLELRRDVAHYDGVFRVGATTDSQELPSEPAVAAP